jgi:hypothetical protein
VVKSARTPEAFQGPCHPNFEKSLMWDFEFQILTSARDRHSWLHLESPSPPLSVLSVRLCRHSYLLLPRSASPSPCSAFETRGAAHTFLFLRALLPHCPGSVNVPGRRKLGDNPRWTCLGVHSGRARNRLARRGHEKHWLGVLVGSSSQHVPCSRLRASSLITRLAGLETCPDPSS